MEQSSELVIASAFFNAMSKSGRNDSFLATSGQHLGKFELDAPVPWLPMKKSIDAKGRIKYYRDAPPGMTMSKNERSAIFREIKARIPFKYQTGGGHGENHVASAHPSRLGLATDSHADNEKDGKPAEDGNENEPEEEPDYLRSLDVVWTCPVEENMGVVVIVLNVMLKGTSEWLQLRYSLKESAVR